MILQASILLFPAYLCHHILLQVLLTLSISSHSGALGSLEKPRPLLRQSTQVPPALPGDLTHTSTPHLTHCVPPSGLSLNSMA